MLLRIMSGAGVRLIDLIVSVKERNKKDSLDEWRGTPDSQNSFK